MSSPRADQRVPAIVVDYDGSWIRVDLQADLDVWAETEVRLRLAAGGQSARKAVVRRRAQYLATMARLASRDDAWGLFLLSPGADGKVLAAVTMVLVELEPGDEAEPLETARRIVAPDDLPCVEPPELAELQSPAGTAVRGLARIARGTDKQAVTELVTYAWVFRGYSHGRGAHDGVRRPGRGSEVAGRLWTRWQPACRSRARHEHR